jgi:hypothetical protein
MHKVRESNECVKISDAQDVPFDGDEVPEMLIKIGKNVVARICGFPYPIERGYPNSKDNTSLDTPKGFLNEETASI